LFYFHTQIQNIHHILPPSPFTYSFCVLPPPWVPMADKTCFIFLSFIFHVYVDCSRGFCLGISNDALVRLTPSIAYPFFITLLLYGASLQCIALYSLHTQMQYVSYFSLSNILFPFPASLYSCHSGLLMKSYCLSIYSYMYL
jgi:hypothetical protein